MSKLNDLLLLHYYDGVHSGQCEVDFDNYEIHNKTYMNWLSEIAKKYELDIDKNIENSFDIICEYLENCLNVVDIEELSEEIAKDIEDDFVEESEIDWNCDNSWQEQRDGLFTKVYDKLLNMGCKIITYNKKITFLDETGKIEEVDLPDEMMR